MKPALVFENVVKAYGARRALDGLSLSVPRGSIFGLVGANGAGKTTFMSVTAGLLRPDSGTINVLEAGPYVPAKHRGRLSVLPQDSLPPYYARVGNLLYYYARLQGLGIRPSRRAVDEVLEWVNLSDRKDAPVRSLSHGMKRRFTVAQAFLGHPELIILDEPMNGLDPSQVASLRHLISSRRGAQTIIISSHVLPELETLCDHVAFLDLGKLTRFGKMEEVTQRGHLLRYTLRREPQLDVLRAALPDCTFTWDSAQSRLTVVFGGDRKPEDFNQQFLPRLLEANCGLLEISRGSDLESVYLQSAKPG
jgi:ABC-2 type transport system ATP-binding protein